MLIKACNPGSNEIDEIKSLKAKIFEELNFSIERQNILLGIRFYGRNGVYGIKTVKLSNYDNSLNNDDKAKVIVLEYINGIELSEYLDRIRAGYEKEDKIQHFKDVIKNLIYFWIFEFLFGNGFYHSDMHIKNLMLDEDGAIVIIDYGYASTRDKYFTKIIRSKYANVHQGRKEEKKNN